LADCKENKGIWCKKTDAALTIAKFQQRWNC